MGFILRCCCRVLRPIGPLGLVLIGICCSGSVARSEEVTASAHVLDLDGKWYLFPNAMAQDSKQIKLTKWGAVSAHSLIRLKAPASDNYIIVVGSNLEIILQQYCHKPSACYQPIMVPETASVRDVDNELSSMVGRVLAFLVKEPLLSMVRTRGGSPQFAEAVVPVVDGKADLSEVMHDVEKGRYAVTPFDSKSANLEGRTASIFDWDPEKQTAVWLGSSTPGLYDITPSASSDRMENQDISIRVLLCAEQQCSHAVSSFERVRASTEKWNGATTPETIHQFLRAYLVELAHSAS
jgi:hypothetical protein